MEQRQPVLAKKLRRRRQILFWRRIAPINERRTNVTGWDDEDWAQACGPIDDFVELCVLAEPPWMGRLSRRRGSRMSNLNVDLSQVSDQEIRNLIERGLSGNDDATETLIAAMAPVIHVRVARALLRRQGQARGRNLRQEVEDFVQEVFAALYANGGKKLLAWTPGRGLTFLSFVGFLAEREVAMMMRTHKRNPWTEDPTADNMLVSLKGSAADASDRLEARDLLRRLCAELRERLSPQGRQYFHLLYIEHRSVKAVADETGTTTDALYAWRSRLSKMLRQMRDELAVEEKENV